MCRNINRQGGSVKLQVAEQIAPFRLAFHYPRQLRIGKQTSDGATIPSMKPRNAWRRMVGLMMDPGKDPTVGSGRRNSHAEARKCNVKEKRASRAEGATKPGSEGEENEDEAGSQDS